MGDIDGEGVVSGPGARTRVMVSFWKGVLWERSRGLCLEFRSDSYVRAMGILRFSIAVRHR